LSNAGIHKALDTYRRRQHVQVVRALQVTGGTQQTWRRPNILLMQALTVARRAQQIRRRPSMLSMQALQVARRALHIGKLQLWMLQRSLVLFCPWFIARLGPPFFAESGARLTPVVFMIKIL
jgi:hypothetical protein